LISWLVMSVTVWLIAKLVPGFQVDEAKTAVGVALVFGVLNYLLGTLLYWILGIGTLGLGLLFGFVTQVVVVALLLQLTDSLVTGFKIDRFRTALIGGVILAVVTKLLKAGLPLGT
jgi:putative membrane protein